jgi:predicted lipid-binding transport protein (Tim44 family)
MKRFLAMVVAGFCLVGLVATEAEAKRLGGARSFGMQRQTAPSQPPRSAQNQASQPAAQPAPPQRRSWMGPLAGLAAGIGLAALFSHLGLGEGLASVAMLVLLVVAAVMLFRLLSGRGRPQPALATANGGGSALARDMPATAPAGAAPSSAGVAAGFDTEGFLREARRQFIRLQAANDAGNLEDLREFTTPEVFAELRLQLQERGDASQQTDVVSLEAELLELVEEPTRFVASVHFSGSVREEAGAAPAPFVEVWHLTRPKSGGGWMLAGLQQPA